MIKIHEISLIISGTAVHVIILIVVHAVLRETALGIALMK